MEGLWWWWWFISQDLFFFHYSHSSWRCTRLLTESCSRFSVNLSCHFWIVAVQKPVMNSTLATQQRSWLDLEFGHTVSFLYRSDWIIQILPAQFNYSRFSTYYADVSYLFSLASVTNPVPETVRVGAPLMEAISEEWILTIPFGRHHQWDNQSLRVANRRRQCKVDKLQLRLERNQPRVLSNRAFTVD